MITSGIGRKLVAITSALALISAAGCGGTNSQANKNKALVVDTTFDIKTIDPARQFEFTGSTIDDQIYQTALEFKPGDFDKPVDGLCSYTLSKDQKVVTLKLADKKAKFSDGTPVTVDDIVFSYNRLKGIGGNPGFFLDGVTVKKVNDSTITLTSKTANPSLPYVLPNSSLGIVNSKAVKKHGGTTGPDDKAEQYLNKHSQGSGPYMIDKYNPTDEVDFKLNPHYSGDKPAFERVVMRNVKGETQKENVQSGQSQIALDLGPDQIKDLDKSSVTVKQAPGTHSVMLFMTMSKKINPTTSNDKFQQAVRYAVNYDKLQELTGGAKRLASPVPNIFIGHVPSDQGVQHNPKKAKKLLKEAGYDGKSIKLNYSSDQTVSGVPIDQLAQSIQAQLKNVGINIKLAPASSTVQLDNYRSGKQGMGISTWGADFPDPSNYLVFAPGGDLGLRSQWKTGMSPQIDKLTAKAKAAGTPKARDTAYQALFRAMNQHSPFASLLQPTQNVVANKSIKHFTSSSTRAIIFASVK